jgi:hypothetical protein
MSAAEERACIAAVGRVSRSAEFQPGLPPCWGVSYYQSSTGASVACGVGCR